MSKHVRGITLRSSLPRMAEKMVLPEPTTALGRIMTALTCSVLELVFGFDYCGAVKTLM